MIWTVIRLTGIAIGLFAITYASVGAFLFRSVPWKVVAPNHGFMLRDGQRVAGSCREPGEPD